MEKKLTVIQTAELLGVSKEAIYNRIRRGSLDVIIENGIKYVLLTEDIKKSSHSRKISNNINDAYIELLKSEMKELKEKNRALEADKDRLIAEKEKLLIESKEKIEQIYKQRDEQLKTILSLATKNILEHKSYENSEIKLDDDVQRKKKDAIDIDVDIQDDSMSTQEIVESYSDWQDLRDYLKQKGYSKKEKKIIKEEFNKNIDDDVSSKKNKKKKKNKLGTKGMAK